MAPTTEPTSGAGTDPLAAGEAGARLVRGGSLRILAYVGAITTSVVAMPFVTRHLHRADYGRYVVVTSLMLIVAALTEGGIANLGVREFSTAPDAERREFMRGLIAIRVALSVLGGIAAVVFTLIARSPTVVVEGTAIAAAGLVLANLQVTLGVPLTARLRLGWLAALDFAAPATTALVLIVLVIARAPFLAFFGAADASFALTLAITAALVRGDLTLRPAFGLARWAALLRESFVFAAAAAITTIYFQVVVVAMSVIATSGQTGIFSLAFRILSVVNGIPVVIVASAFPVLLRAGRDDPERLRGALGQLLDGNLLLGGWLSLLLVAGAPFAVRVIGGPGYPGASTVLRILGAGVAATFVAAPLAMTLLSVREYRSLTITGVAMIAAAIAGCAILIPAHGARGAAIVTVSLEALIACTYAATLARTHPRLRPPLARTARIALALAIAFAAALVVPVSSVAAAAIGTATLAIAAVALRAAPVELLATLRARPD
jgi:O-antigen/teichoic acid export membrane protein